jgi:type IV pilus assembly protein PilM
VAVGAPPVGLDIGTSAVRAARMTRTKAGFALSRFGQVALPPGCVVDGEIRDQGAVSEAISQLWKRAKLGSKKAIVGVANQRVVVRQVDLPYLEEKEFRSSLRFQVADHVPMPLEGAQLDFQIIDDYMTADDQHMMRVLLVAAATDMVEAFLAAASAVGIMPVGVDLTPFAVARAVSAAARGEAGVAGSEAIVDVGAGITNLVIHHNGEARFVRILLTGGDDITAAIAQELEVSEDEAEALKLDAASAMASTAAQRIIAQRAEALVNEVRGSLDYYLSQEGSEPLTSLILTGGASLTPGLRERLEAVVGLAVESGHPLADVDVSKSGLSPEQVAQVEPVIGAAAGLAMGSSAR